MKRILGVLITLFTLIGHQSNAQQIKIDIGSALGQIGDIVSIPVTIVSLPLGAQGIESCQGAIVLSDPSVAEIVGFIAPNLPDPNSDFDAYIVSSGIMNFSGNGLFDLVNGLLMTVEVKILDVGCSDLSLTDLVSVTGASAPNIEFVVGGVIYDDLATDFLVDEGVVCSVPVDCPLHIQELGVYLDYPAITPYYINPSGNSTSNYEDFTNACIPYNDAPIVKFEASQSNVYMAIYLDIDNDGVYEVTVYSGFNTAGILEVQFPTGGLNFDTPLRIIVSDQPITGPAAILACGEVEDYVFCGNCSCDLNDITLGPFEFIQNQDPAFCSAFIVNIPPVLGCSDVDVSYSYYFEVFNSAGTLVYELTTTDDGYTWDFPAEGEYTFVVTYTIIDNSGCEQNVQYTQNYHYTGCDCACDLDDLVISPFNFSTDNDPTFCEYYVINFPQVVGCDNVKIDDSYSIAIYDDNGGLLYSENGNGMSYPFPYVGVFTIVATYIIVDDSGCEQTVQHTEDFNYTGCDCELFESPTNTGCRMESGKFAEQVLSWDPVPDAVSYEVEFTSDDPNGCCSNVGGVAFTSIVSTTATSITKSANGACFSWRVRAVCANGTTSPWSIKNCSCGPIKQDDGPQKSLIQFDQQFEAGQLHLVTVPNPATNHVDITLSGLSIDITLIQPEMIIYDMTGKVVYKSEITLDETKRVDVSSFQSGVYIVKIIDNDSLLSTEKLIIE
ncbi:MAG: T9SS type A sorting domain-containing protein [Crocinitomicaceae bacterium]|nr:T9SS type A sorting domain-containing protein [Flavobacteriales bacterium]NQZ38400.1 T9SS type A sorting domain-containing protein [Crocinitomicaceae bacterium]